MALKTNTIERSTYSRKLGGKVSYTKSTITNTRKLTRGESAGGLLTTASQIGMIGITIITLAITQPLNQFNKFDLIAFTPNYGVNNEYVAVENPLEHYDYSQFGQNVVNDIWGWVEPMESWGTQFYAFWTSLIAVVSFDFDNLSNNTVGAFADEFGSERQLQLYLISKNTSPANANVFEALTFDESNWLVDNRDSLLAGEIALFDTDRFYLFYVDSLELFGGGTKWFFTEPSVIDILIQEGFGS